MYHLGINNVNLCSFCTLGYCPSVSFVPLFLGMWVVAHMFSLPAGSTMITYDWTALLLDWSILNGTLYNDWKVKTFSNLHPFHNYKAEVRISFSQRKSASDQCEERTACEPVIAEVWWYRPGLQKVRIRFWKGKKVISAFPHWPLLSMPWALLLLFYKTAESYEYLLHIHERWWATSVYSALWQLSA